MPTYSFKCEFCETEFEKTLKIINRKDPETAPCPKCNKIGDVKLVIRANFELMSPDQLGKVKPPQDWRSFINNVKKSHKGSDFTTW